MSNATKWKPVTQLDRRQWLLANGEVVSEPDLEETPSGIKVRIAGTTTSAYRKDMETLLQKGAQEIAKSKGTRIWMPLDKNGFWHRAGVDVPGSTGEFNIIKDDTEETLVWWSFRHSELPIEATITVRVHARGRYYRNQDWVVDTHLWFPSTAIDEIGLTASVIAENEHNWSTLRATTRLDYVQRIKLDELIRDKPHTWPSQKLGAYRHPMQRQAVKHLLEQVREFDSLQTIQIPDLRDPEKPAWLTLELHNTNFKVSFEQDCCR